MSYFDAAVFAEDVTNGKPDPEIFFLAASRIGSPVSQCAVFEDAASGVEAAKKGKFPCIIARDNSSGQDLRSASLIIQEYDPPTLLEYLKSK